MYWVEKMTEFFRCQLWKAILEENMNSVFKKMHIQLYICIKFTNELWSLRELNSLKVHSLYSRQRRTIWKYNMTCRKLKGKEVERDMPTSVTISAEWNLIWVTWWSCSNVKTKLWKESVIEGFPDSAVGQESACIGKDPSLITGSGRFPCRRDRLPTPRFLGFSCGSAGKESAYNLGDLGSIPGLGRSPGEVRGYPLQSSDLENSVYCSPWGPKLSDKTERFSLSLWTKF